MKKILFPTDFSEIANNAFVYALKLARVYDAEVVVLHVFELPNLTYTQLPDNLIEIYNSVEIDQFENFRDYVPYLRELAEKHNLDTVKMSHVLKHGNLLDAMKEVIQQEHIDMVVMGTKGATGNFEVFLGTATSNVITALPVMVLAVPDEAQFTGIKSIGFATTFSEKDSVALMKIVNFATMFGATVKCITVKTDSLNVTPSEMEHWQKPFEKEPVTFFLIPDNDVKETILDFIHGQHIDVFAMPAHKRNFFKTLFTRSLAEKLSFHTDTPILSINI